MSEEKKETGKTRKTEIVNDRRSVLYEVIRGISIALFHTLMPVKFYHRERVTGQETPYLLISNHQHALDPVVLALMVPKKQLYFLGKKELAKGPLMQRFFANVHCILVDRHNTDLDAMRACMKVIRQKKGLIIFPEGTRKHEGQMEQIENGTALIALRSRCPIIPVYIDRKLAFFRLTRVYAGEPIPWEDLAAEGINAETCERMNDRFREIYREMVREHPQRS